MNHFFQHLSQPEYVHVLINPIPVYGLVIGLIALAVALGFRLRAALIPALVAVAFSSAMAWPVYTYGEKSYDRVYSMVDKEGDAWLNTHMHRAERLIYIFYALAVLAVAAIVLPLKWPHALMPLAIATLIFGIATLGVGSWIAYAGGKVRHREFRSPNGPAPESAVKETDMG
ncbi:MAG: hypothetical protein ACREP1_00680 [Rhodanobacteraceae bacterium]